MCTSCLRWFSVAVVVAVLALALASLYLFHKTSQLEKELDRATKPRFERIAASVR